ncbi:ovochymase-2-like isoform X2 [Cimex lectularius]|nr:ovochymase-2-like isoform X2 [Cimex lectularius]
MNIHLLLSLLMCMLVRSMKVSSKFRHDLKITNGVPADNLYQFVARIVFKRGTLCTGSIISKLYTLTAAHCLLNPNDKFIPAAQVLVQYKLLKFDLEAPEENLSPGKEFVIHPNFIPHQPSNYDFALIKVAKEIIISKYLDLSDKPWPQDEQMYKRKCITVGWGSIASGRTVSNQLLM